MCATGSVVETGGGAGVGVGVGDCMGDVFGVISRRLRLGLRRRPVQQLF